MLRFEPGIEPAFVGTVIPQLERRGLLGQRVEGLVALGVDALLVGGDVLVAAYWFKYRQVCRILAKITAVAGPHPGAG